MTHESSRHSDNRLLAQMSQSDFALIEPDFENVSLRRGDLIAQPNQPVFDLWFPVSGIASQIAVTADNRRLEVGLSGREGFCPICNVLGVDRAPHEIIIQVEGEGLKIRAKILLAAMDQSPSLRTLLLRYVQAYIVQTGYTALSNGSGIIGERLARWLLMCHDRIDGDNLRLTHEFLGVMLGVRRSGVTEAIHVLEGMKIIRATRGNIQILDRGRLKKTAGDSYGVPEAEFERLFGSL